MYSGVNVSLWSDAALNWPTFTTVAEGVRVSTSTNDFRDKEISVAQGVQYYMTAICQAAQTAEAVALAVFAAIKAGVNITYKNTLWYVGFAVPLVVGYAASRAKELPLYAERVVRLLQKHMGTLSQLAMLVSSVALFALGQQVFAITTITGLAIGILSRSRYVPHQLRQAIQVSNFYLANAARIFVGGWMDVAVAVLEVAFGALDLYTRWRIGALGKKETPPEMKPMTWGEVDRQQTWGWEINREAVISSPIPPAPDVSFDKLKKLFKKVDWEKERDSILKKLAGDNRWKAMVEGDRPDPITYVSDNIALLIKKVKDRQVMEGEPTSYELLDTYLKHVISFVDESFSRVRDVKNPTESERPDFVAGTDMIYRLAIEIGPYCGPGMFEHLEDMFNKHYYLDKALSIPLEQKIFGLLQLLRAEVWEGAYAEIAEYAKHAKVQGVDLGWMYRMMDMEDIHTKHCFDSMVDTVFKMGKYAAGEDSISQPTPFQKLTINYTAKPLLERLFGRYEAKILNWFIERTGTPALPLEDITVWWVKWSQQQGNDFANQLTDGRVSLFEETGRPEQRLRLKKKYAVAMLKMMQIIQ